MIKTNSAGGVIVKNVDNQLHVLLLGTDEKKYFLPKGHVEGEETLEEAALREVAEEAGLAQLKILDYLGCNDRYVEKCDELKTIHYFLMVQTNPAEKHQKTTDNEGLVFEWHPIDSLPELYLDEQLLVIKNNHRKIKKVLKAHGHP